MKNLVNKVVKLSSNIKWSIIIAMVIAGVSAAIITGIIALYLFAAWAHLVAGAVYVKELVWRG